jgi:hypothetical protein
MALRIYVQMVCQRMSSSCDFIIFVGVEQLRVAQEHYLSRAQNISTIATLFSGGTYA